MSLTFYGYFRSSTAHRCRIAFNLKGVAPDTVPVNLREGAQRGAGYLARNPQGLVPALDTGAGLLTQSLAIIEWLDETRPEPPLLPGDAVMRAQIRGFALTVACDIHPLQNLRVLSRLGTEFGQDDAGKAAWCRHWIAEGLRACEAIARRHADAGGGGGGGAFTFGAAPTLADVCLIPQMTSADRFGLDLSPFPRLREIRAAAEALPAFADAAPARQPDAA